MLNTITNANCISSNSCVVFSFEQYSALYSYFKESNSDVGTYEQHFNIINLNIITFASLCRFLFIIDCISSCNSINLH